MERRTLAESAHGRQAARAFHDRLLALLPRLRTHSRATARNSADAEDLVQGAVANALAAWESCEPGTN